MTSQGFPTNKQRAEWAREALAAYKGKVVDEEAIGDLICDLLHLARREFGKTLDDTYHIARSAADMNSAETLEDKEE